ncbi:MAG TPA: rhomboid family intramembrane serine protease [Thermoanaerobaculia bacterium]|nr:rhomboid family intramembrane serine protease [Thermoanaerobaculia bacterium]
MPLSDRNVAGAPETGSILPRRSTPATRFIISAIVIGFAIEIVTGAWQNPYRLARLGAVVREWIFLDGQYWRLVSAMFLHGDGTIPGGLLHVALNLLAIVQIGRLFELMFGTRRYLFIYFTAGIIASVTSALVNGGPSVGASGAIFGILGAFVLSVRRSPRWRHERAARSIVNQLIFWIVANIAIGMRMPQIDNSAHLGGLIAGLILGAILPHAPLPPPPAAQAVIDVTPYGEGSAGGPAGRRDDR